MHTISSRCFGRAQRTLCVLVLGAALASAALASPLERSAADANVVSRSVYERGVQANALLAIDQNRTTVVDRIVAEWGAALSRSSAGISSAQLRTMLEGLRADHLLAASLAGSLSGLRDVLANSLSSTTTVKSPRLHTMALGDTSDDLVYTPVSPCRLFDTRPSQGGLGVMTPNVRRTYGATTPVANQGGPGGCNAATGAAVALIQIGTLTPSGNGSLQGGAQGVASFPNALILYQAGDQYGTAVAMPLNIANGRFDLQVQFAATDLYGDLLGYFQRPKNYGGTHVITGIDATDSGGFDNTASGDYSTVGGGAGDTASGFASTVGGGDGNTASGIFSTVGGGEFNTASGLLSTVGGGNGNIASGTLSTVGGGIQNIASGIQSTVGGGMGNFASGDNSTVGGGFRNAASASYSWAGGNRAKTQSADPTPIIHHGAFVWADFNNFDFYSAASNEFAVRATGGVRFVTGIDGIGNATRTVRINPNGELDFGSQTRQMLNLWGPAEYGIGIQSSTLYFRTNPGFSNTNTGGFSWFRGGSHNDSVNNPGGGVEVMRLASNGTLYVTNGTVGTLSDRSAKEDFTMIDPADMLDRVARLPVSSWVYKANPGVRHIGPTAQDFRAAFGLGDDDERSIATVDADGVALAAIQGLNAKLEARDLLIAEQRRKLNGQEHQLAAQQREFAEQRALLAALAAKVEQLGARAAKVESSGTTP